MMTNRHARVVSLAFAFAWAGCQASAPRPPATASSASMGAPVDVITDPPSRPGVPLVFIAMPSSAPFQATRRGLMGELGTAFNLSTFVVGPDTTAQGFASALTAAHPVCLVLMNNTTVRLYRDYQSARAGQSFPPAVVVMTSYLEDIRAQLKNTTGIAYEVPGVTAFVGLRDIVKVPISRIGVIHAPSSAGFIERQRTLAAKEQIALVPIEIESQPGLRQIQEAFRTLRYGKRIDALWVLNDNRLLKNGKFLLDVWQPQVEALRVPVIVGTAPLVNAEAPFGTFAVLPDHAALGGQAANLVLDLSENGWDAAAHDIDLPLSTVNVLDVPSARERFGLRESALNHVDLPLE